MKTLLNKIAGFFGLIKQETVSPTILSLPLPTQDWDVLTPPKFAGNSHDRRVARRKWLRDHPWHR